MKALHNLVLLVALATTASGCGSGLRQANRLSSREQPTQSLHEQHILALIEDLAAGHDTKGLSAHRELVKIGQPAVPHLAQALKDPRKNVRWLSVETLGCLSGEKAASAIFTALKDEDADVRRYAISFLGRRGKFDKRTGEAFGLALADKDTRVVLEALRALEQSGETAFKNKDHLMESLCRALQDRDDKQVIAAAQALEIIGNPKAVPALLKARYRGGEFWPAVCKALATIGSREAVKPLLAMIKEHPDSTFLRHPVDALRRLGDPSINAELLGLTRSPELRVRTAAITALGFTGNTAVVGELTKILSDAKQPAFVRETAVQSLGRVGDESCIAGLVKALDDRNDNVRREAAGALGQFKSTQARGALLAALDDPNALVVMHAAQALGRIGDRKAVPALLAVFERHDAVETIATAPHFANPATVAHHALESITGRKIGVAKRWGMVTEGNLAAVREAWTAIALGLAPCPRLHRSSPPDLDRLAALLAEKVGGRWAKDLHNGLPPTEQILRGRIDARTDIAMVFYDVFPFGADDVDRQAWLLAAYARADSARIVGVNAQLTVLQLRAEETSLSVQEASRTITQLLGLSPPKIALDTFRPVLAAAERALANAHAREYPEVPVPDSFIAAGHPPKLEQHPQGTIFTWEFRVTSGHGFSARVQLGESGRITVLEANVWRVGE